MIGTHLICKALLAGVCAANGADRPVAAEYLSDLQHRFAFAQQGWGRLGIDVCAHAAGREPLKLKIKDKVYTKGLGHHAPGEIIIDLDGEYEAFEAEIGVQWQSGNTGSVVFKVFVDGEERFDSGVVREKDAPRPIRVAVTGAQELRLVVTDAGDGITCDCADWAEARLKRSPGVAPAAPAARVDVARFARVVTYDPNRLDGSRANRVQEFRAEDVFPETELAAGRNGIYTAPRTEDNIACIGLQWLERRRLVSLGIELDDTADDIPPEKVRVQCWTGESAWQGKWQPLAGEVTREGNRLSFSIDWKGLQFFHTGTVKIRWLLPAVAGDLRVKGLTAYTRSRWDTAEIMARLDRPLGKQRGTVSAYNGEFMEQDGSGASTSREWDMSEALRVRVRHCRPRRWRSDRTSLHFTMPSISLAVGVDDVLEHGSVYVPACGLHVATERAANPKEHPEPTTGKSSVLPQVRRMKDQSLAQAMERVHRPAQDMGPTMLSLACDNDKFVVDREGAVRFGKTELRPVFGTGNCEDISRRLERGWIPVVTTTVRQGSVLYRQCTSVAPRDEADIDKRQGIPGAPALCVCVFTIENSGTEAAHASLRLSASSDLKKKQPAQTAKAPGGAVAADGDRLIVFVDSASAAPLELKVQPGALLLDGRIPARTAVSLTAYIPAWNMRADNCASLKSDDDPVDRAERYWKHTLSKAMQVEVPEPLLMNVIRASQVHCLIAARNDANGKCVAPWIASMSYGPLESEANSIIRGMALMGHEDFARRSLEFFIRRYNKEGYLTTGYTMMGTGWHLKTLGEFHRLARDRDWLRRSAPEVARVCKWIMRQREKTKRLGPDGQRVPEYGLMPPGVMADWNAFAYYFCLNGYYCSGLKAAATALADIGHPEAEAMLRDAEDFRGDIIRAYRWTQSRMPVLPLRDGTWVPGYPSQVHCPGPTNDFFPGEDGNRSWAYDVELGSHHLIPQGILDATGRDAEWMMNHMEDVAFLSDGWFDYPGEESEADWFNLGGFSKVQPYYTRNPEVYALRDDVKPFIRSYFNMLASLLNTENLSLWEHFHHSGAWNKTHETGYFLQQTRFMLVMERADELWLAPFVTSNWMKDGMAVAVSNAPTAFGKVSYRIESRVGKGYIEASVKPPTVRVPRIVIRLRHPEGKPIKSVTVDGQKVTDFDAASECIRAGSHTEKFTVRATY